MGLGGDGEPVWLTPRPRDLNQPEENREREIDFDGPSLDFLGSRKPAHEGIKERYPYKSRYFTVVGQFFVKTAGDRLTVCEHELL